MARAAGEPLTVYCKGELCMRKENSRYRQVVRKHGDECIDCYTYDVAGRMPNRFHFQEYEPSTKPRTI